MKNDFSPRRLHRVRPSIGLSVSGGWQVQISLQRSERCQPRVSRASRRNPGLRGGGESPNPERVRHVLSNSLWVAVVVRLLTPSDAAVNFESTNYFKSAISASAATVF